MVSSYGCSVETTDMQAAFVDGILFSLCAGSLEPVLPFCPPPAVPEQTPSLCYSQKSTINSFVLFDTHYILCYYNLVFEFLCYPEMGVWAIHPGHMLFKLENRVIIMPFLRHCNGTFFIFTIIYFLRPKRQKGEFLCQQSLFYQGDQRRILRSCRQRMEAPPIRLWTSPAPSGDRMERRRPYSIPATSILFWRTV